MTPPPVPTEEAPAKDAGEKREGKTERPKREPEEVPDMTVEEAHKALNALPKVCVCGANIFFSHFSVLFSFEAEQALPCRCICICVCSFVWRSLRWSCAMVRRDSAGRICDTQQQEKKLTAVHFFFCVCGVVAHRAAHENGNGFMRVRICPVFCSLFCLITTSPRPQNHR